MASLNVIVNSFRILAWQFNLLRHACGGGAALSKSSYNEHIKKTQYKSKSSSPIETYLSQLPNKVALKNWLTNCKVLLLMNSSGGHECFLRWNKVAPTIFSILHCYDQQLIAIRINTKSNMLLHFEKVDKCYLVFYIKSKNKKGLSQASICSELKRRRFSRKSQLNRRFVPIQRPEGSANENASPIVRRIGESGEAIFEYKDKSKHTIKFRKWSVTSKRE